MQYKLPGGFPIVPVRIGVSQPFREFLERSMERVPESLTVNALIDTGASVTIISQAITSGLRLQDRGECNVRGFDGNLHASPEAKRYLNYDISFAILAGRRGENDQEDMKEGDDEVVIIPALQAVGANLAHPDYDVLLGLDVLRLCILFMDLDGGHFDISPIKARPVIL